MEWDPLIKIIERKNKENGNKLQGLIHFIKIYRNLQIALYGKDIKPSKGLPQGSSISPLLFNIYIDDILVKINENHSEAQAQAFVDDLVIVSGHIGSTQRVFDELTKELDSLNLAINPDKCDLITLNQSDYIMHTLTNYHIIAKKEAKYLGSFIDVSGTPSTTLTEASFGQIIQSFTSLKNISIGAKIRLFHTYVMSKIAHLLPLYALSEKLATIWTTIRKVIFKYALGRMTTPLESLSFIRCDMYAIIIRPLLKLATKLDFYYPEAKETVKKACEQALILWETIEDEKSRELLTYIEEVKADSCKTILSKMDRLVQENAAQRLAKHNMTEVKGLSKYSTISRGRFPNLLYYFSNASIHIVEDTLINNLKAATTQESKEKLYEALNNGPLFNYVHQLTIVSTILDIKKSYGVKQVEAWSEDMYENIKGEVTKAALIEKAAYEVTMPTREITTNIINLLIEDNKDIDLTVHKGPHSTKDKEELWRRLRKAPLLSLQREIRDKIEKMAWENGELIEGLLDKSRRALGEMRGNKKEKTGKEKEGINHQAGVANNETKNGQPEKNKTKPQTQKSQKTK